MTNTLKRIGNTSVVEAIPGTPYVPAYSYSQTFRYERASSAIGTGWFYVSYELNSGVLTTDEQKLIASDLTGEERKAAEEAVIAARNRDRGAASRQNIGATVQTAKGSRATPVLTYIPGPSVTQNVSVYYVTETYYVPERPATPGVAASFVTFPPKGWTSFAHSIASLYAGYGRFRVSPDNAGAVVGLAAYSSPVSGYSHIPQGLMFTGGAVKNMRTSVSYGGFTLADEFEIRTEVRDGAAVLVYSKNGAELAFEPSVLPRARLYLTSVLNDVGDLIDHPILFAIGSDVKSTRPGAILFTTLGTDLATYAQGAVRLKPFTTRGSLFATDPEAGGTEDGYGAALLPRLTTLGSELSVFAQGVVILHPLVTEAYGGAIEADGRAAGEVRLSPLQSAGLMVTGENGFGANRIYGITVRGAEDAHYAEGKSELGRFETRGYNEPNYEGLLFEGVVARQTMQGLAELVVLMMEGCVVSATITTAQLLELVMQEQATGTDNWATSQLLEALMQAWANTGSTMLNLGGSTGGSGSGGSTGGGGVGGGVGGGGGSVGAGEQGSPGYPGYPGSPGNPGGAVVGGGGGHPGTGTYPEYPGSGTGTWVPGTPNVPGSGSGNTGGGKPGSTTGGGGYSPAPSYPGDPNYPGNGNAGGDPSFPGYPGSAGGIGSGGGGSGDGDGDGGTGGGTGGDGSYPGVPGYPGGNPDAPGGPIDPGYFPGERGKGNSTWVYNPDSGGSTAYSNYGFNSYAKIGGKYYGAAESGLYELEGESDDTRPIRATVGLGVQNFGSTQRKTISEAYLGMSSAGNLFMKVVAEGHTFFYKTRSFSHHLQQQRVPFGKGLRANYLELELYNENGCDFELDTVEFQVADLTRRI